MIIEIKSSIIHLSFFFLNSSQSETYSPYKHVSSIVKQFINYLTRKTKLAFQFFLHICIWNMKEDGEKVNS